MVEGANVQRTYPTLTYGDTLTLYHGGREFRFMSVVGDADGTTVLYLPKEKILITGDVASLPDTLFHASAKPAPPKTSENSRKSMPM